MRRRALRVMRPARLRERRWSVLVVITGSHKRMRVIQRAKLWARLCTVSQAALARKLYEGDGGAPRHTSGRGWHPRPRRGGDGWFPVPGSTFPVGDEGAIGAFFAKGPLRRGRGIHPSNG